MRRGSLKTRLIIAAVIAVIALVSYFGKSVYNPFSGGNIKSSLTLEQEVQLGWDAAPQTAAQFGGEFTGDPQYDQRLDRIGDELLAAAARLFKDDQAQEALATYQFEFTVLSDDQVVNAFALPGGPTFITMALYKQLDDAMVAGVMGHEVGHVLLQHGAQRMAKQELFGQLSAAGGVAAGDQSGYIASQMFMNLLAAGYSREHERESDDIGYVLMVEAGYDPRGIVDLMELLGKASGGGSTPNILATHPNPEERAQTMRNRIEEDYQPGELNQKFGERKGWP